MGKTKGLKIGNFRGMDYSSAKINASSFRAVDGKNWVYRDGVNQKRKGWKQIAAATGAPIDGFFPYEKSGAKEALVISGGQPYVFMKDSNGKYIVTQSPDNIPIVGTRLDFSDVTARTNIATYFTSETETDYKAYFYPVADTNEKYPGLDRKLTAIYSQSKIYIPAGDNYYCYFISTRKLYALRGGVGTEPTYTSDLANYFRELLQMYCSYRSELFKIPTTTEIYAKVTLTYDEETGEPGPTTTEYTKTTLDLVNTITDIRINTHSGYTGVFPSEFDTVPKKITTEIGEENKTLAYYLIINPKTFAIIGSTYSQEVRYYTMSGSFTHEGIGGSGSYYSGEKIILILPDSSARRTPFPMEHGTEFGISGLADRAFVASGNRVWFSEADDYSYFPDTYWADIGTDKSKVNGFLRLSDGVLAIFKDKAMDEPLVSYMSGERNITYDDNGNVLNVTPVFRFKTGAATETPVNEFCTGNMPNDSVFFSKDGVRAVVMPYNVSTDIRAIYPRSLLIDRAIKKAQNIDSAVCRVYKNDFYVAIDGCVWVADHNLRYKSENGDVQYEWYKWDNFPVRVFSEYDDMLIFGTEDGRICAYSDSNEEYDDIQFDIHEMGDITLQENSNDTFVYNGTGVFAETIVNGNNIYINGYQRLKYKVLNSVGDVSFKFEENSDSVKKIVLPSAEYFRWSNVVKTAIQNGCYVKNDNGETEYIRITEIYQSHGEWFLRFEGNWANTENEYSVYKTDILPKEICNVDSEHSTFQVKDQYGVCEYSELRSATSSDPIFTYSPVVSEWWSPILDMGANTYKKTLRRLAICAEATNGRILFGYLTKHRAYKEEYGVLQPFDFADFDFTKFSLDITDIETKMIRVHERGFNYLQFFFRSDQPHNCIVHDITATYDIYAEIKGVQ